MTDDRGVSVVICCYNSAERLPITLDHLLKQKFVDSVTWEVLIVDNASTDNTAEVAREIWQKVGGVPLRVVYEGNPGLSNARIKGLNEAKYSYVSFIDDDNWVAENWVFLVHKLMSENPKIGVLGGDSEAVTEIEPPPWFEDYKSYFAVGSQNNVSGDVTWTRGHLWGAGLNVRKYAWEEVLNKGFQFLESGRKGEQLSSGEDSELCFALRLRGWLLWYDKSLKLKHYIPASRFEFDYLRKLFFGFGRSSLIFDLYLFKNATGIKSFIRRYWFSMVLLSIFRLIKGKLMIVLLNKKNKKADYIILLARQRGQLYELMRCRKSFPKYKEAIDILVC